MEAPTPRPETIDKLRCAVDAGFAMFAGMQLDVFTPLKDGAKTAEEIAKAIDVSPARLRLLLYGLVAAGLLTERDGYFSNTPEADQYLVKGNPSHIGQLRELLSHRWTNLYPHTAESIRRSVPQAK
jgi:DNA-binding IclR family transcriptional regulator